jgi:hypothetical protein
MDADSDGNHIATLLMTFFYRHLPELVRAGHLYLAMPPLYRIDIGKETFWARDDQEKDAFLGRKGNGRAKVQVQRFKGLGEMNPGTLKETTLAPSRRTLLRVTVGDAVKTDATIATLMGRDVAPRFQLIMDRAVAIADVTSGARAGRWSPSDRSGRAGTWRRLCVRPAKVARRHDRTGRTASLRIVWRPAAAHDPDVRSPSQMSASRGGRDR